MTQKELDAKLREITVQYTADLEANSACAALYVDNIDKTRQLIQSFHTTISLDKERLKQCHIERSEIIRKYRRKRFELLDTSDVVPGANSVVKAPISRAQCYVIQRMLVASLHEELRRHGHEDVDDATVTFNLAEDGSLSWRVYIPSLDK